MFSLALQRKQYFLKILSDEHALAILLELSNARDVGKSPIPHSELLALANMHNHRAFNWQYYKRELIDRLAIVELVIEDGKVYGPDTISYQLNPQMDPFCAILISSLFKGEEGKRSNLPPPPNFNVQQEKAVLQTKTKEIQQMSSEQEIKEFIRQHLSEIAETAGSTNVRRIQSALSTKGLHATQAKVRRIWEEVQQEGEEKYNRPGMEVQRETK